MINNAAAHINPQYFATNPRHAWTLLRELQSGLTHHHISKPSTRIANKNGIKAKNDKEETQIMFSFPMESMQLSSSQSCWSDSSHYTLCIKDFRSGDSWIHSDGWCGSMSVHHSQSDLCCLCGWLHHGGARNSRHWCGDKGLARSLRLGPPDRRNGNSHEALWELNQNDTINLMSSLVKQPILCLAHCGSRLHFQCPNWFDWAHEHSITSMPWERVGWLGAWGCDFYLMKSTKPFVDANHFHSLINEIDQANSRYHSNHSTKLHWKFIAPNSQ